MLLRLILCFWLIGIAQAESGRILYQIGVYQFMQQDADRLIELGEFLARSTFSPKDKQALLIWSIQDFKSVPAEKSANYYKDLKNNLIPKIRKMKNNTSTNNYRADLYLGYYHFFNTHPEYKKLPDNFLAVIDRYNPPIKEALSLQQLRFNLVQQQLRMNQMVFNQTMGIQKKTSNRLLNSIKDQVTRDSITIPGGIILQETSSKIIIKGRGLSWPNDQGIHLNSRHKKALSFIKKTEL